MKLGELAFACFVYRGIYKNDAYGKLMEETQNNLDLSKCEHREKILEWLNDWGIRYLAKACHKKASQQLKRWHENYGVKLFDKDKNLWDLNDKDLNVANEAYQQLLQCKMSYRAKNQKERRISFGDTAAAKILSVIRPNAFVAWDKEIRKEYVGTHGSYAYFLRRIKSEAAGLKKECEKNGFKLEDLPQKLNREDSNIPKLIDECNWITITKECPMPDEQSLRQWADWSS